MDKLQDTLLEFGHGMAFVGRQVRFTVAGDELVIDLLLFHVDQLRYVVVELKIGQFDPAHVGQLGTYVALVDDRLRKPDRHAHTVGILLVAGRNEAIVRYALAGAPAPPRRRQLHLRQPAPDEQAALPAPTSSPQSSNARPTGTARTRRNGPYRPKSGASCRRLRVNRHGFRAVFMLAAAPGGGQWLQRSGLLRPRPG